MGITYAPAYANKFNKFMVNFDIIFIYPWIEAKTSLYLRFIMTSLLYGQNQKKS